MECSSDMQAVATLQDIASREHLPLRDVLRLWSHKIMAHVLMEEGSAAALSFYQEHTGIDTMNVLKAIMPGLLRELVQHLGEHEADNAEGR